MPFCNHGRFRQQVRFLRRQFLQDGELPFTNVLPERSVTQALKALNIVWLDRVYSPLVTLWVSAAVPMRPLARMRIIAAIVFAVTVFPPNRDYR